MAKTPIILKYIGLFLLVCIAMVISWIIVTGIMWLIRLLIEVSNKNEDAAKRMVHRDAREIKNRSNQIGKAFQ